VRATGELRVHHYRDCGCGGANYAATVSRASESCCARGEFKFCKRLSRRASLAAARGAPLGRAHSSCTRAPAAPPQRQPQPLSSALLLAQPPPAPEPLARMFIAQSLTPRARRNLLPAGRKGELRRRRRRPPWRRRSRANSRPANRRSRRPCSSVRPSARRPGESGYARAPN